MTTLAKYLGRTEYRKGEVGLEIETEANQPYLEVAGLRDYWRTEADGSLRNVGVEYIFSQPYNPTAKAYTEALRLFGEQAKISGFIDSVYTSVHVHLNMNDKTLTELINFITLYWLFEEPLTEYCGDNRNGNLFCLKTSNAEAIYRNVQELVRAIDGGTGGQFIARLDNNRFKYSGLNIVPLRNLGSVEVRTHPGCYDVTLIDRWVKILHMIYKKATTYASPVEIINRVYRLGYRQFFESIFEEYTQHFALGNLEEQMKNGIWYATSVAGIIDNWKDFGTKQPAKSKTAELKDYYVIDDAQPTTTVTGRMTRPTYTLEQLDQMTEFTRRVARTQWATTTTNNIGDT